MPDTPAEIWFAAEVIRKREAKRMTCMALAEEIGIHVNTVYRLEEGRAPRFETAMKIATFLQIDCNPPDYVVEQL